MVWRINLSNLPTMGGSLIKILQKHKGGYVYQCIDKGMGCIHDSEGSSHPFFGKPYWEKHDPSEGNPMIEVSRRNPNEDNQGWF